MSSIPLTIAAHESIGAQVTFEVVNGTVPTYLATHSTTVALGPWTTVDGAVVSADGYPLSLPLLVVCSPDGVSDTPRRRVAEEVHIPASNRWAPEFGWDGAVWRPLQVATRGNEMTLVAGSYDPVEGTAIGTAPSMLPAGQYQIYDPWDQEWTTHAVMQFSGSDLMTTRTQRWATNDGVGALGVFVVDDVANGDPAWVLGFTTPDPSTTFGLGVTVTDNGVVSLMLTDETGVRPLIVKDLRASTDGAVMLGLRYNARTNTVSLLARGQHVRDEWGTTLASINGRPPGESLAALDFALMYSMGEDSAVVLDVAMWVGPPTEHQWQQSINAYTELYGVGTTYGGVS